MSDFIVTDDTGKNQIIKASSEDTACAAYAMTTAAHPNCVAQYNRDNKTVSFIDRNGKTVSTKILTVEEIS